MKPTNYILFLLLFTSNFLFAQLQFKATASKTELGVNQRFKITFSLNKQGADNFKLPNMANFKLVGGPMNSFSQSNINGKISFLQSYTFFFMPTKKGTFTIPSATVEYKGKRVKSNEIKVRVGNAVAKQKNPNDPEGVAAQNIHVVAEISNTTPYLGEGIYVVYKLYVSDRVSALNPRVTELPKFNGFWNQEVDLKNTRVKKTTYKGESYRYLELRKLLLMPQKSGKLYIDPMNIELIAEIPTGRGDFWGNAQVKRIKFTTSTGRRIVRVKELPLEGKPVDFTGAVGTFNYTVTNSKPTLKAGESSQIKVTVQGTGNLKLFELPKISTPTELEVYTPKRKERVHIASNGLKGSVSDTYAVVPEYKGKYKIPASTFSYFNTSEKKYVTLNSEPIVVEVTEGKTLPNTSENNPKNNTIITPNTFKDIETSTTFSPIKKKEFYRSNLFYLLLFLPLMAIPIGMVIGNKQRERRNDIVGNKTRKANKLVKKYLSEAKKQLGNKEHFYIALERALHNFLKAKLHVETSDISQEKIAHLLAEKGVDAITIHNFSEVINQCNFARYTPTTNLQMEVEYEKAKHVILKIDQELSKA